MVAQPNSNKENAGADVSVRTIPSSDGGGSFLELLDAYGVECLFYNPGSDFYPVLEQLSKFQVEGRKTPRPVMCLTEHLALSMAHGYAMQKGTAQAVMVHVGLGTMELGGALHNISKGREPVLIIAGRSPYTFEGELEGGRDRPYHWDQELFDQLGLARQFAKWTYELKTNSNLHHVLARALQMANSEPKGPVYLVLPRELLAEKQESVKVLPLSRFAPPSRPAAESKSLEKMADILLNSESPIILTEYLGCNPDAVSKLVKLAEFLGAPVIEPQRKRMNFPANHPLYLPGYPREFIESSDAILLLDIDVPWSPALLKTRKDAKIMQIDVDAVKSGFPLWGFPVDVSVNASTAEAIPELLRILKEKRRPPTKLSSSKEERLKKISQARSKIKENLRARAEGESIRVESLLSKINEILSPEMIVVSEGVTNDPLVASYVESTLPGTFFALGGSSLGDGLGNALGLKLANPEKDVVCIVSDGGFVYSNPTSVFWASRKYDIPILTVVINNGGYRAMKSSVERAFPEGFSKKNKIFSGAGISPAPDFVLAAKACGASGASVKRTEDLSELLRYGLQETTEEKRSFVLDAIVEQV
ncbi:MAG: thiamine pyrophosphate-requiring protein [Thaumarchaeota archaeon]|nr:thiamine pyrophosphate-requiring protein [Nitrososphaerota archaeon]